MENEKKELSLDEMSQAAGGTYRTVNTGYPDMNAAVRSGPSKSENQIASLVNGTVVDTVNDVLVYDKVAGRHFVQITYTGKDGKSHTGWIASSLVGMDR